MCSNKPLRHLEEKLGGIVFFAKTKLGGTAVHATSIVALK